MSIYYKEGVIGNKLTMRVSDDDFEELLEFKPTIRGNAVSKDVFKKYHAEYFISGELKANNNNEFNTGKTWVISRSLLTLDFDEIELTADDFIAYIDSKLKDFTYYLYPTISYTIEKPRFRLIVKPSRNMNEEEYNETIDALTEIISLPIDKTSREFSRIQGLPCTMNINEFNSLKRVNKATPFPVINIEAKLKHQKVRSSCKKMPVQEKVYQISDAEAIKRFKDYIESKDEDYFDDYNNALKEIFILAQAVRNNEISQNACNECAVILAQGNPEYETGNKEKIEREIEHGDANKFIHSFSYSYPSKSYSNMDMITQELSIYAKEWHKFYKVKENKTLKMTSHTISKILMERIQFVRIGLSIDKAKLYYYDWDNGIYDYSSTTLSKWIYSLEQNASKRVINEVIDRIISFSDIVPPFNSRYHIAVNNGIFNTITKNLEKFSPSFHIISKLGTNFNPHATKSPVIGNWNVDSWFQQLACGDAEIVQNLWEVIAEAINPNYTRNKMAILIGDGNNGKGTFQALISNLIGFDKIGRLLPNDFSRGAKLATLLGKVCNIGDDFGNHKLDDISNLMSIVTGDPILIEDKYEKAIEVQLYTFCIFSANEMPSSSSKKHGWYRRLLPVPLNANFDGDKENKDIKNVYVSNTDVLEYVLYKALHLDFESFTESAGSKKFIEDYKDKNDNLRQFIRDVLAPIFESGVSKIPLSVISQNYTKYQREVVGENRPQKITSSLIIEYLINETGRKFEVTKNRMTQNDLSLLPTQFMMERNNNPTTCIKVVST